ncbi:CheR family methyltransferase [Dongia sp.]|uniref:CheR family methyltransferase n=1 Tax=Dongia sp. TaxID=1977262 RepID=UPI0037504519
MKRPKSKKHEEQKPPEKNHATPVVGIGASAGGIDALRTFVPAVAKDSGLAFVVVQHLDPDHTSHLSTLLGRATSIPVVEIHDDTPIEADHIYVIPPNTALSITGNRLLLTAPTQNRGFRTPIDGFLISLAEARGENAACVILSGTGSDGTLGLRAIKEHGGATFAQKGAEYDGMMRSALGTGLVDFVLPVEEIPGKLADYFRHLASVDGLKGPDGLRTEAGDHLAQICSLLQMRTGHDFRGYKDKTVARRVQRRMQVLQIDDVTAFIERLRKDPQELDALLQDLLIGVTNFFRDPKAFDALGQIIPQIFSTKTGQDTVRVWVPGCSTGEEAYSIGILLKEFTLAKQGMPKIQIFASDIDEEALQIARIGRYPAAISKDVPQRLLDRYFVHEDGTYRISGELREACLFSAHNLLRDAPFSKLDLVSCRNLLIYLTPDLQNRLIPLFHYALNPGGYLFLGSSENVTRHTRLFSTVDKAQRIFQRRALVERRLPEFPLTAPEGARRKASPVARPANEQESLQTLAERQLLDRYAPAFVVINGEGDLIHASGRTGKYLELAVGTPKTDIFSLARRGLRPDLRAGVHKAMATGQPVLQSNVVVGTNGGRQAINLVVHPLRSPQSHDPLFMVVFQDIGGIKGSGEAEQGNEDVENSSLRQLEQELRATKERLQTTTEELESSNEELKSGNEELSSMNEELQSANEELETSKEELQSINEELQTVNAELNARVEELSRANSDIANLLESTQIATVFLDHNLTVKSFTPAAKDVFRLVESDTGRPISHVRPRFASDTVQEDAERVMRTLGTIERQVQSTHNESRYVMRVLPYRTVENVIAGVVITFTDVTRITAAEARINELTRDLKSRLQSLETLIELVPVGILMMEDSRTGAVRVNRYGAQLLGESGSGDALRPVSTSLRILHQNQDVRLDEQPLQKSVGSGEPIAGYEAVLVRPDGSRADVLMSATPLANDEGKVRGGIAVILDISERKRGELQQQVLLHELQHRVKNIITTVGALATRMLKGTTSLEDFSTAFTGRLSAMAKTHELLTASNWQGAGLRPLIDATVRAYGSRDGLNISVSGPDLVLAPAAASTLGQVLYELATNAVKYGALKERNGRVDIKWRVTKLDGSADVALEWIESDGPVVGANAKEGFGTAFIRRSVEYELNGKVDIELQPTGFRCRILFPSERNLLDGPTGLGGQRNVSPPD